MREKELVVLLLLKLCECVNGMEFKEDENRSLRGATDQITPGTAESKLRITGGKRSTQGGFGEGHYGNKNRSQPASMTARNLQTDRV